MFIVQLYFITAYIEFVISAWVRQRLIVIKDGDKPGIYFLKPSREPNNYFVDRIPMVDVKNVFRKSKEKRKNKETEVKRVHLQKHMLCGVHNKNSKSNSASEDEDSGSSNEEEDDVPHHHRHPHEFQIETFEEGSAPGITGECAGRAYHFRVVDKKTCKHTVNTIRKISQKVRADADRKSRFAQAQVKILRYYESRLFQLIVGGLILAVMHAP